MFKAGTRHNRHTRHTEKSVEKEKKKGGGVGGDDAKKTLRSTKEGNTPDAGMTKRHENVVANTTHAPTNQTLTTSNTGALSC